MAGVICPQCGAEVRTYRNPIPTADVIIVHKDGVVLIKRKNPPYGWALPGDSSIMAKPLNKPLFEKPKKRLVFGFQT